MGLQFPTMEGRGVGWGGVGGCIGSYQGLCVRSSVDCRVTSGVESPPTYYPLCIT